MSKFNLFMKENKITRQNTTFVATSSLLDEEGNPLVWEIKPLTTRENDFIRDFCVRESGSFDHTLYLAKMVASSVVYPNLNDAKLQNNYGVLSAEDLLKELVDCPAEYQDFTDFISSFNGYEKSVSKKVESAKK